MRSGADGVLAYAHAMTGQQVWLGAQAQHCLLFVPGFMTGVDAYRGLLEPLVGPDLQVGILGFVAPGLRALLGRVSPEQEAEQVAAVAAECAARGQAVWLGGHSRGGQVAWRAAQIVEPAGLLVVDPVDGQGPRSGPAVTLRPPTFRVHPLVIALGAPGRCAPAALGPRRFADADPRAELVVVDGAGHADILSGRSAARGRRLCPGSADPDAVRSRVTDLLRRRLPGDASRS